MILVFFFSIHMYMSSYFWTLWTFKVIVILVLVVLNFWSFFYDERTTLGIITAILPIVILYTIFYRVSECI